MDKFRNTALCALASVAVTAGLVAFSAPSVALGTSRQANGATAHAPVTELARLAPHRAIQAGAARL